MKTNMSPQTKSFVILFGIGLAGCILSILLSSGDFPGIRRGIDDFTITSYQRGTANAAPTQTIQDEPVATVDTSTWKTYKDPKYNFEIQYAPAWKISKVTNKIDPDFYTLAIDPGKKYMDMHIYVSPKSYYALMGLPTQPITIGGVDGINAHNILFGLKKDQNYFTFDLGSSISLTPEFNAMVKSIKFN